MSAYQLTAILTELPSKDSSCLHMGVTTRPAVRSRTALLTTRPPASTCRWTSDKLLSLRLRGPNMRAQRDARQYSRT